MHNGFKFEHVFLEISFQRKFKVKTNRQKQDFTKITGKSLDKRSLKRYKVQCSVCSFPNGKYFFLELTVCCEQ